MKNNNLKQEKMIEEINSLIKLLKKATERENNICVDEIKITTNKKRKSLLNNENKYIGGIYIRISREEEKEEKREDFTKIEYLLKSKEKKEFAHINIKEINKKILPKMSFMKNLRCFLGGAR